MTAEPLSATKRALLAQRLRHGARSDAPTTQPGIPRLSDTPPLSFAQERLWFMEQFAPGTAAYVIPFAVRLRGPLDVPALRAALDGLPARHDSLRMSFIASDDGRPLVELAEAATVPLQLVDADCAAAAHDLLARSAAVPFDLSVAPLLRVLLVTLADDDHVLQIVTHHIVGDGWSSGLLLADIVALYRSHLEGTAAPRPPTTRYGDYAAWQRDRLTGPGPERDLAYWCTMLAGVPPLELATDRPRSPEQHYAGAGYEFVLDAQLAGQVRRLGAAYGATLYMTLLAGFEALLFRHCGQRDFAVGSPVAGRIRPELENLIGLFVNTLAVRADLSTQDGTEPSFAELLARTRGRVVDALAHQELPLERLVQELHLSRDVSRPPLFQAEFALQNYEASTGAWPGGVRAEWFGFETYAARLDLSLYVHDTPDGLYCRLVYDTDLFERATVAAMADRYGRLLDAAAAQPLVPVADLDLLTAADRAHVLALGTAPPLPSTVDGQPEPAGPSSPAGRIADLFERQAAATPRAPALVYGGTVVRYRELNQQANRLAHALRERGVGPGSLVGIAVDRSVEMVVAVLGVLKSGAAYVPLDRTHPPARLAVPASRCGLILVHGPTTLPYGGPTLDLASTPLRGYPQTDPSPAGGPDDLAYVVHTSGSTGMPKGVLARQRPVVDHLRFLADQYQITPADTVLQVAGLGFDASVRDLLGPLCAGAKVVLLAQEQAKQPAAMLELVRRERVTCLLSVVPSLLRALVTEGMDAAPATSVRLVLCSGEPLYRRDVTDARALFGDEVRVVNQYGPTECTMTSTRYTPNGATPESGPVAGGPDDGMLPAGLPVPGARVYVLDQSMRLVPPGVPGEIHIGGYGVSRGYLGQPALTAEQFVPDPFTAEPGARMYRTGDLGRWRVDGELEFLGRRDQQIKIRGNRVELGEVEAALAACPGVTQAAAALRGDRLVGYVCRGPAGEELPPATLRRLLLERLPDYMIPAWYVWLERLPLTANGKVDRRALPEPADDRPQGEYTAPDGPVETAIAAVWASVLRIERVGATDDFFDLGGHSLLATQLVARLRRALPEVPRPISVMDVFKHHTVRELAALATGGTPTGALLHELTRPVVAGTRIASVVCLPYGGASAVVYQPLADALPPGYSLYAVAVPGHDIGLAEPTQPIGEVAQRCADEVLSTVHGPLLLYGHCGPGGALAVEIARRLEAAGRELSCVLLGGVFPTARPPGRLLEPLLRLRLAERLRSDRAYTNWLISMGAEIGALDQDQLRFLVANMRQDTRDAEDYFTALLQEGAAPLRAPIVSVVGTHDPGTDFYRERFREWHFLTGTTGLVVIDQAGHYFLKHRADDLAGIISTVPERLDGRGDGPAGALAGEVAAGQALAGELVAGQALTGAPVAQPAPPADGAWWLADVSRRAPGRGQAEAENGPRPSMRRFLVVASSQFVSITGSALTEFAIPLWIYLTTGSVVRFALYAVLGLVPGMVVAPLAGAIVDRYSRRRVMLVGDCTAGAAVAALAILYATGSLAPWHIYGLIAWLSVALTFQRLAYNSAVPQLVPKHYLGHANGFIQLSGGMAQFIVPLIAVAVLATVGLGGILAVDVTSYAVAIATVLLVRFPNTLAFKRRESLAAEIAGGMRYSLRHRGFRAMLVFFATLNVFLAPLLLLLTPLVLAFGTLGEVARVSVLGGAGGVVGGLAMLVWGGPRHHRMRGVLLATLVLAGACLITGVKAALLVVCIGSFGMSCALSIVNGVYFTIVQTKVPQRLHGRVIALNTLAAWSTLPLGWAVVAPLAARYAEPALRPGGALASTVGTVVGVGPGRGTGLVYIVFALCIVGVVLVSSRTRVLSRFDDEVPDAVADDLVGLPAVRRTPAGQGQGHRQVRASSTDRGH